MMSPFPQVLPVAMATEWRLYLILVECEGVEVWEGRQGETVVCEGIVVQN